MTITTTTTTIEYMAGFQYTNNSLDFFPHTSTALSAGSEGYAKSLPAVLGGGSSYQYKYVFTYTDHLGNIRLKYVQDPSNNNRISILEEDHYYPYGLKHSGYNSFHQIFATDDGDGPGTGIVLTPVNPFLGDSHKYKFGGMEYQDEFSVNTYDFGARNYDPALGRWMNLDPLAEMMRRHSPYNYAFNNPVYFIDPDGMIPIPGGGGNLVPDTKYLGSGDSFNGTMGSTALEPVEQKAEVEGLNTNTSAPTLSKQNDVAGTGMAMGADGVGDISGNSQKKSSPSPKWYKDAFKSVLKNKFRTNFTFDDAIWHYRLGGGMPVDVNTNSLDFSSLSAKDFNNTELTYQGQPLIYVRLSDISNFIRNTNQALIYGSVGVVYLGNNTIMALPDVYDFDIKLEPSLRGVFRDYATMLGQMYNGGGTPYNIQFIGTAKIKN